MFDMKIYPFFKRLFDIVLSGAAILMLSPLLIPIMIALKCTGEHYIFYGQTRIGRNNSYFKIWKFATMLLNSPNMTGGAAHHAWRSENPSVGWIFAQDED